MSAVARRRGWCPGALRPMATGDGLLVRVRLRQGQLTPSLARALAACARRFGNGLLDLSGRGNLQLRGVTETSLGPLQERLGDLDLLDESEEAERVRNVIVSPLAGLDPSEAIDMRPIAAALEATLVRDIDLHALPEKFCFLLDGGGAVGLAGVEADIAVRATADGGLSLELGGRPAGVARASEVVAMARHWALAFLREARGDAKRMRDVVDCLGLPDLPPPRERPEDRVLAGFAGVGSDFGYVAASPAFGRLEAAQLEALADCAERSDAVLRLTPFRAILLAPVGAADAGAALAELARAALIVDRADPRLFVSACAGRPGCASGEAEVQRDAAGFAAALAPLLGPGSRLHVSGCPKGCANPKASRFVAVAEAGDYRLGFDRTAGSLFEGPAMDAEALRAHFAALARPARSEGATHG